MPNLLKSHKSKAHGYALIVVLFSLAIITSLAVIAQKQNRAGLLQIASAKQLSLNEQIRSDKLRLVQGIALSVDAKKFDCQELPTILDVALKTECINLSGLVDVNSAHPELIRIILTEFGIHTASVDAFLAERETGRRFLRISEFLAFVDLSIQLDNAKQIFTTASGLEKINLSNTSDVAAEIMPQLSRATIPDGFATSISSSRFLILEKHDDISRVIGVVKVATK